MICSFIQAKKLACNIWSRFVQYFYDVFTSNVTAKPLKKNKKVNLYPEAATRGVL